MDTKQKFSQAARTLIKHRARSAIFVDNEGYQHSIKAHGDFVEKTFGEARKAALQKGVSIAPLLREAFDDAIEELSGSLPLPNATEELSATEQVKATQHNERLSQFAITFRVEELMTDIEVQS